MTAGVSRDEYVVVQRWGATAQTWFEKAAVRFAWLHGKAEGDPRWALGYYASRLLTSVLRDSEKLVALLDDDQVEEALERAEALADRLRRVRLAAKLEQTAGRTPAEADAFRKKAASLRGTRA